MVEEDELRGNIVHCGWFYINKQTLFKLIFEVLSSLNQRSDDMEVLGLTRSVYYL